MFLFSSIYLISINISLSISITLSISISAIFPLKGKNPWPGRTLANTLPLSEWLRWRIWGHQQGLCCYGVTCDHWPHAATKARSMPCSLRQPVQQGRECVTDISVSLGLSASSLGWNPAPVSQIWMGISHSSFLWLTAWKKSQSPAPSRQCGAARAGNSPLVETVSQGSTPWGCWRVSCPTVGRGQRRSLCHLAGNGDGLGMEELRRRPHL